PDLGELVHCHEPGQDRPRLDGHVSRELAAVGDDGTITHLAVVCHVHVAHQEAIGAHRGDSRCGGAAVDGRVLTDDGALTDLDPGLLAGILEVLRRSSEDGASADLSLGRHTNISFESDARRDPGTAADVHRWANDRERTDLDVVVDLGGRINQDGGVDSAAHRSTTRAIISASHTAWPST